MALEDYKDIVGASAGIVTFCQMFSGVFLCRDIYRMGSSSKFSVIPFLGGLILSILFYQHALLIGDSTMKSVNVVGLVLNILYLLFYGLWTERGERLNFCSKLFKGGAFVGVLIGYARVENPENVEFRFGLILTIFLMVIIASPLFSLGEIIRTKSTETLPFAMIFTGFIVSSLWLLYGIIIKNDFVIVQNVFGVALGFIELSLFVIFPSKKENLKKEE